MNRGEPRRVHLRDIPLKDGRVLRVTKTYQQGGYNYFHGGHSARGYYVSVTPMKIENGMQSYVLGSGIKKCLLEADRFNRNKLNNIEPTEIEIAQLVEHVLFKEKAELAEVVQSTPEVVHG